MKIRIITYRIWMVLLLCFIQGSFADLYAQQPQTVPGAQGQREMPKAQRRRETQRLPSDSTRTKSITSPKDSLKADSTLSAKRDVKIDSLAANNKAKMEELTAPVDTARLLAKSDSIAKAPLDKPAKTFVPDPKKAMWIALAIPGGGQIYNRKYWKLPIIYGGFVGCAYALHWNNQMYNDYSQAYLDIMSNDPNKTSYMDFLPNGYDVNGNLTTLQNIFKKKKDFYRRYRDLSIFAFIGVYVLSVIDAYVDAELSNFDISNDLSLKVSPALLHNQYGNGWKNQAIGLQCSLTF